MKMQFICRVFFSANSLLLMLLIAIFSSCESSEDSLNLPVISTTEVRLITDISAQSGGFISSDGGHEIIKRGVCWSLNPNPTIDDSVTIDAAGTGKFISNISRLNPNTTYFLRAYAINSKGVAYGLQETFTTSKIYSLTYVSIPAGTFIMGSPITEYDRFATETQFEVTLSEFRMSKYEITNAQFAEFLNTNGVGRNGINASGKYPTQRLIFYDTLWGLIYINNQWQPVSGYDNYPVINVTWYGAKEYANHVGGDLPTEAQWEYACRAGTKTPFNTGDCLSYSQSNYDWCSPYINCENNCENNSLKSTQIVGFYPPNAWGLYDMHGNVWEWCADWYDYYPSNAQTNPKGPETGWDKVIRGGGWSASAHSCRSASRMGNTPYTEGIFRGFRVVKGS